MLKYWRIPPSDRLLYRRRAEFITGVWENAAFAADTGLRGKERALTHYERQSGCRDGDFTSWSSIVLPFSPYYVKPLIILGPKEKGLRRETKDVIFPDFTLGGRENQVCARLETVDHTCKFHSHLTGFCGNAEFLGYT